MKKVITILIVLSIFFTVSQVEALVWDGGHHEFSEGIEGEILMINGATADITGGQIGILWGQDSSSVDVYAGSEIDLLRPNDSSTANVYGGEINGLFTLGDSTTNIYEASLNYIDAVDTSTINMYVENYNWNPTGGQWGGGLLTGTWLNTTATFSIDLMVPDEISHINFIPEPCTLYFLSIGGLFLYRLKGNTKR